VVESKLTVLEKEGKTTTIVCSTDEVLGIIGVADSVRSESRAVIQHLRQSGVKEIVMISGDGSGAVRSAASNLGSILTSASYYPLIKSRWSTG